MTIEIQTGFTSDQRAGLSASLTRVLADSYALYLKTHGYHWNVRGPNFAELHQLFSDQYNEVWNALDALAERIRALGELAPQGYGTFANLTSIGDGDPEKAAPAMVEELMRGHETVIATARAALKEADAQDDQVTVDLLTQRLAAHEKHAWMLRATLGAK